LRPQWDIDTIGAVSDLVKSKRDEWESRAIRALWEIEQKAQALRAKLEFGDAYLADLQDQGDELFSHVMTFTTLVDRDAGLVEAGIE
jgi:hypothetical protein